MCDYSGLSGLCVLCAYNPLPKIQLAKVFLPSHNLTVHSFDGFIWHEAFFNFMWSHLPVLSCAARVVCRDLVYACVLKCSPCFFLEQLQFFPAYTELFDQYEFIFLCRMRDRDLTLFCWGISSFSSHHLLKKNVFFFQCIIFTYLLKIDCS